MILTLAALTAFAPFATDMYLPGFSAIAASLGAEVSDVQLSLSAFFLGLASGQLVYGPLIDRFGRRRPLLAGIALFVAASGLLAVAPDVETFIALRFVQAVGGCAGMIIGRAVIQDLFDTQESARALSLMMVIQGVGPVLAPVLGGYLLLLAGWRAVFVFQVLFGAICMIATFTTVPETLPERARKSQSVRTVATILFGLLRTRAFVVPALASGFALGMLFAFISGSPFVFMELHGASQQAYGWLFALNAVGMIIASQLNRGLLRRLAPGRILRVACGFTVVAATALVAVSEASSLAVLMIPLVACLACIPLIAANGTAVAMSAHGGNAGSASSLIGVLQFGIAGVVSALVGAFHDGTVYPMTIGILACAVLGGVTLFFARPRASSVDGMMRP